MFVRDENTWRYQAYIKANDTTPSSRFGSSVTLTHDGNQLAVGAKDMATSGAVYMFSRSGTSWAEYLEMIPENDNRNFGSAVALSADANTLVVGARGTDSARGRVWVYAPANTKMLEGGFDGFGTDVAISADGSRIAISAPDDASASTGIDGDPSNTDAPRSGAVYVFAANAGNWQQEAYLKASNTSTYDGFGTGLAMSASGSVLAIGAASESSASTGLGGDQASNDASDRGAAYVFARSADGWSQIEYIKSSNSEAGDLFGAAIGLSADGKRIVIGAFNEDSGSGGIDGDQDDNSVADSGAVYVFE